MQSVPLASRLEWSEMPIISCSRCGKPRSVKPYLVHVAKFCSLRCSVLTQHSESAERRDPARRFWAKVQKADGCWFWTGAKTEKGYGNFMRDGTRGPGCRSVLAHRVAWELEHGSVPVGLCVLHKCDNPACVRPEHQDNNRDMLAKGRRWKPVGTRKKLSRPIAELIRKSVACGEKRGALAKEYGVTNGAIWLVVSRRSYR